MTTYKCRYCNGHWQEGPTRNYCETEQCRKCASARVRELEGDLKDALAQASDLNGLLLEDLHRAEARVAELEAAIIPDSGGHLESADCWCCPTIEEHPGGTLIIHNQIH